VSVFDRLVGQPHVVELLTHAVSGAADALDGGPGPGMTQSWLFTGPPGSGRTTAATAFAAALQCQHGGCGECHACVTSLKGTHADVELVSTERLSITVATARSLVLEAAALPSAGRWRVIIIEDADRLTEEANNALLKAIEEPTGHTVWLLCAPTPEDLLPTIRSRCRSVSLATPSTTAVAEFLVAHHGIEPAVAAFAARASQGHIGRARGLATDEAARLQRARVLEIPTRLRTTRAALSTAAELVDDAKAKAEALTKELDATERSSLARVLGVPNPDRVPRWASAQFAELKREQKSRGTRALRDQLDRSFLDLMSFYRDVLVLQFEADSELVNAELRPAIEAAARGGTPQTTLAQIDAIALTRERLGGNANPRLAVEDLMLRLQPA
jgi:DNA polymerase-3 subunit delta'